MGRSSGYHLLVIKATVARAAINGDGSQGELAEQSRVYQNSI